MDFIKKEGKSVDDATEKALKELNISLEDAYVKVIDEGVRGILGIGSKPAIVEVCEKFNVKKVAEPFLKEFVAKMNLNVEFYISNESENKIDVNFVGDDVKFLIGKRGMTLNAIQDYLNLCFNKLSSYRVSVIVNTGDYREKRKETLEKLAANIAEKVKVSKRPYTLNPMNSFERKAVHTALQDVEHISTSSVGEEPNRKVVVTYVD